MELNHSATADPIARLKELPYLMKYLLDGETDWVAGLSNASALIWDSLDRINWAGFYRVSGNELVLAPFQGKPACARISYGKGVCGTAWMDDSTIVVPDVHKFPGHIACDAASRSEIVVVLHRKDGSVFGLLDIDSPETNRFSEFEKEILEKTGAVIENLF